jgi:processive 1,2-diacylglycerol beta-glucosyltransferase
VKKVLILTAGFGEGHNSAARGIRDGLLKCAGADVQVEVHDIFSDCYGFLNDWAQRLYLSLVDAAPHSWGTIYKWLDERQRFAGGLRVFYPAQITLRRFLERFQPDLVVSVYPAYPHMIADILGANRAAPFKRVVVVTDSITINAIWYRCSADFFLLPNDATAVVLRDAGVPAEKMRVFGFPVGLEFGANGAPAAHRAGDAPLRLLYMVSSRNSASPELARRLAAIPGIQLTVGTGKSARLHRLFESALATSAAPFEIAGWTDDMPRMLHSHDVVISKAGGATVQEAIAAQRPLIISHIVPGQEQGNARLIAESGCGTVALSDDEVVAAVERALADGCKQWRAWAENVGRLSRPRAALDIAEFLLAL